MVNGLNPANVIAVNSPAMAIPPAKVPLILAPTPLHKLEFLSKDLGLDLWIKRDDLTGFAFGGNKGRKLELTTFRVEPVSRGGRGHQMVKKDKVKALPQPPVFVALPEPKGEK